MSSSLAKSGGRALVVSQFTLCADTCKGNKLSIIEAAQPDAALHLFHRFCDQVASVDVMVARGKMAAQIAVELVNDGPVTICLDSREISVVVWVTRDRRHLTLHRNHSLRGCLARHQVDLDERLAR